MFRLRREDFTNPHELSRLASTVGLSPEAFTQDLAQELHNYFPAPVRERFGEVLGQHPLHAELLATHLTNLLCNRPR